MWKELGALHSHDSNTMRTDSASKTPLCTTSPQRLDNDRANYELHKVGMSARVCCVAKIKQSRRTLNKLESATVHGIDGDTSARELGYKKTDQALATGQNHVEQRLDDM